MSKKDKKKFRVFGETFTSFGELIIEAENEDKARLFYEERLDKGDVTKTGESNDIIVEEIR